MSEYRKWRKLQCDDEAKAPAEEFQEYLEGYLSALELYPVCQHRTHFVDDLTALMSDFWNVSYDASKGAAQHILKNNPTPGSGEKLLQNGETSKSHRVVSSGSVQP